MAHCDVCCLRLALKKDKTLPKHYGERTEGLFGYGGQRVCEGSSTTRYGNYRPGTYQCSRQLSGHTCPSCQRKPLKLNKNGKFPQHRRSDGGRCDLSEANR